jgi:hypothetical protein
LGITSKVEKGNLWVYFSGPAWVRLSHCGDPISITSCCPSTIATTNFHVVFFKSLRFIKIFVGISYKGGCFRGLTNTSYREVTIEFKGGSSSWNILYSIGLGEKSTPNWIFSILAHGSFSLMGARWAIRSSCTSFSSKQRTLILPLSLDTCAFNQQCHSFCSKPN